MAIRLLSKGGSALGTEEALSVDWDDTFGAFYNKVYADNTGGSMTGSTETDIATLTIPQNDFGSSFSVLINAGFYLLGADNTSAPFKLYVNGSVVKTITMQSESSGDTNPTSPGSSFCHFATGLDSTAGNIIIKVTATTAGPTSQTAFCTGLTVLAISNNT